MRGPLTAQVGQAGLSLSSSKMQLPQKVWPQLRTRDDATKLLHTPPAKG